MNQKKNSNKLNLAGTKTKKLPKQDKITAEERIQILERKLELERKENSQLKGLLEVANEFLGKF